MHELFLRIPVFTTAELALSMWLDSATEWLGPNSIEKKTTEKPLEKPTEKPLEIPYTKNKRAMAL